MEFLFNKESAHLLSVHKVLSREEKFFDKVIDNVILFVFDLDMFELFIQKQVLVIQDIVEEI